ncbi:hypothetical protein L6472_12720 [Prevotella sp. E13-17]|uniref:hypothetical protein n=1 Tax=Prevotella sp. E13-17 TaxID=2913616 RepID=UPI001EDAAF72|nr:hypothetical protein [Prevotella sp. E13-17]UKK50855.1 hypothetical protein L6472_12720 [Prevotella sp. E13-17]
MKRVVVLIVLFAVALLAVLPFTKPSNLEHEAAVRSIAMKVANQKLADVPLPDAVAEAAPETVSALGSVMAMQALDAFMRQHFKVRDYVFVTVGTVNYHGMNVPVTVGALGKVYLLTDEAKIQRIIH